MAEWEWERNHRNGNDVIPTLLYFLEERIEL